MIAALLRKDLVVLRRSPALLALIVIYPLLIATGLGLALTREPEPPRIAVVNLLESGQDTAVQVGGATISIKDLEGAIAGGEVDSINVGTRERAVRMIEAGTIDGALVIPADAAKRLQSSLTTGGIAEGPELEVLYRSSGPLDGTLVRALIASRMKTAENALSGEMVRVATGFLRVLRDGGTFHVLGRDVTVLGLRAAEVVIDQAAEDVPEGRRAGLEQTGRFARLARENLSLSERILDSIARPLTVRETGIGERDNRTLTGFAVGIAGALSLMLVGMTLGAALLGSERQEGTLRRLLRGGRGAGQVVAAKVLASAAIAASSGALLLLGLAVLGATPIGSAPWWVPALLLSAGGFAALGVLLGAALRDARAATLAAILLAVPVAVLALIPEATIGSSARTVVDAISLLLPFDAARSLLDAAIASEPDWGAAGRLAAQTGVFGVLAAQLVRRARA